jgi:hypothetical protein
MGDWGVGGMEKDRTREVEKAIGEKGNLAIF